jgi:hypothetical protein
MAEGNAGHGLKDEDRFALRKNWDNHLRCTMLFRDAEATRRFQQGMDVWIDQPAWIGGYPFKVALGEDVFNLRRDQWFSLPELKACRGELGCNEFVFRKDAI